jgi:hypothetical protein
MELAVDKGKLQDIYREGEETVQNVLEDLEYAVIVGELPILVV